MKPNICVVVLDAVRAANLSCYGHDRSTTPNIDNVADESIVFERAVSPAATTMDSISSLFSGLHPGEHQAGNRGSLSVAVPHLPELLSGQGYRTGAITTNPFITPGFGFEEGVDEFYSAEHRFQDGINVRKFFDKTKHLPAYQIYLRFLPAALNRNLISNIGNALQFRFDLFTRTDQGAKQASRRAKEFLTESKNPWFLYLHYSEAHMKDINHLYKLPEDQLYWFIEKNAVNNVDLRRDDGEGYEDEARDVHERLYDATIRYLDEHVGKLVRRLKQNGQWEETLFVVTADHGECFGSHGHIGHGALYEPGIHVPLIIKPPSGMIERVDHANERVNTLGLFETLAKAGGIESSHASVESVFKDQHESVLVQDYCATWDWSSYGTEDGTGQHAIYEEEMKLIQRGNHKELYNLEADPEEQTPLPENSEAMRTLSHRLSDKLAQLRSPHEGSEEFSVDRATAKRLQDLGYL